MAGKELRREVQAVTRRRRKEWEAEQARVRHAHAAAADAATAAAEARAQAAEAAQAECSRLTARVRADQQALQARRQLLDTARRGLMQHIEKVSPLAVRHTLNISLLPPPLCPPLVPDAYSYGAAPKSDDGVTSRSASVRS